ncbi:MAG: hypothetical protein QOE73_2512 [Verrucomicrobiota bacterium]
MKPFLRLGHSLRPTHYVFAGVFLVRVIVLARLTLSPFLLPLRGDMHFYDDWAQRILHGQLTDHLAFYGLPLYPYLLALIYKLTGYGPFLTVLLQAILEAGTGVIIYKLGLRVFSSPIRANATTNRASLLQWVQRRRGQITGIIAAFGWAFFVPAQVYAVILMPTVWFVFAFWLLIWLILRKDAAPSWTASLGYGLLIGFAAMGVATILFLVPLVLAAIFLKPHKSKSGRPLAAKLSAALLLFFGIGVGAVPCWAHNCFIARDSVFLSAHSGVNFWIGNNPFATGYPRFPPGLHAGQEVMLKDSINVAEKAAGHPLKRSEISAYWSTKATEYIQHHFGDWLKLLATKVGNFWNAFQYDDLSMITALWEHHVILLGPRFGIVAALALPGLLIACFQFPLARWIAGAVALHMASLLSVFVTERYRLAVVPGLLLFAAAGVIYFWETCMTANYRRASVYFLLLMLATWFVSVPKRDPSLWALDSYNSGWQALESNDLATAERKLNLAYAYVPENAETNFALGNLRLLRNEKNAAKSFYLATLNLDPNHEGAFNNLGILALQEKRWDLAAKFFTKALQQDAREAKTYYLLAQAYFNGRDFHDARLALEQAIKLKPGQPEFLALSEKIKQSGDEPSR